MKGKHIIIEVLDRRVNRVNVMKKDENDKLIPVDSFKFTPGINFVPASVFADIEKSLKFKFDEKVYKKLHIDKESKSQFEVSVDFAKLTPKQAEALIEDIYSVELLEELKREEARDSVRAALMNQIDNMVNYTKKKKSKVA